MIEKYIRSSLLERYEFFSYGHAIEILNEAYPEEWGEIQDCLERFRISVKDLKTAGGNETGRSSGRCNGKTNYQ